MLVNSQELLGKDKSVLTYLLLSAGNNYPEQFQKIVDNVNESEDKLIQIDIKFNGIEIDPKVLETFLDQEYKKLSIKLTKRYSDLEKLAEQKAEKMFNTYLYDQKKPISDRLTKIQETINNLFIELECL